jgi:para-nitrobenzyl esterase
MKTGMSGLQVIQRALLSAIALGACWVATDAAVANGATNPVPGGPIAISTGKVAGTTLANGVHAYFGIPFAAPPVGALRWHEPLAAKAWADVYDASTPKPACAQRGPTNRPAGEAAEKYSEDCLYLNVWAPPGVNRGASLPVVVFIHGGGFSGGSPSIPAYSGAELAKKGVVTVNLAYRLGIFGYFALPELTRESAHNASGDWGSLDQIAGLEWIQRNIAAFGGNPANVTVMGHSAGSESVYQLQASPLARGLFAKVSGWSGADLSPGGQVPHSLAEGETLGLKVLQMLQARDLAALRSMPWEQIQATLSPQGGMGGPGAIQTRPIVDGYFLPDVPDRIFKAGRQNDVPLYSSSTREDLGSAMAFYQNVHTVAELRAAASAAFGDAADEFSKLFPVSNDAQARQVALIVSGNTGFGISNRDWVRDQAASGKQPAYLVQWEHVPPPDRSGRPAPAMFDNGPSHGSDIPYWLGTYVYNSNRQWNDWDKELSDRMSDTLIAFASSGNPSTSMVKVPRYDASNEERTVFGDSIYVEHLNTAQIEFLRAHAPQRSRTVPAVAAAAGVAGIAAAAGARRVLSEQEAAGAGSSNPNSE